MLGDEETWSSWDHITGEAFAGEHAGQKLDWWSIQLTTVEAARAERPDLRVLVSDFRSLKAMAAGLLGRRSIHGKGFIPPPFKRTMSSPPDPRLDRLVQGLGVIDGDRARFYPMQDFMAGPVEDADWGDRTLILVRGAVDGVPRATWADGSEPPMQLLSRWYGFSFTWPDCSVWGQTDNR